MSPTSWDQSRKMVQSYKHTKHAVYEHLGKVERTVDSDLDGRIESLRELNRCYQEVLATATAYTNFFAQGINMQRNLSEALTKLASREDSLNKELNSSGTLMLSLHKNGEELLRRLSYLVSSLDVLTNKTIVDTLTTIERHDKSRMEYDMSRHEWNALRKDPNAQPQAIDEAEKACNAQLEKYSQLKSDVRVKLTLLEENRIKVMRKQLALIQSSLHSCLSDNLKAIDSCGLQHQEDEADIHDDPMGSPTLERHQLNSKGQTNSFLER